MAALRNVIWKALLPWVGYRSLTASSRAGKCIPAITEASPAKAMLWTRFVLRFVRCKERSIFFQLCNSFGDVTAIVTGTD